MANQFTQFEFSPPEGLRSRTYSPTQPESEDAIRDQVQGISDQLRDHINALQELLSSAETPSGAQYIGSTPIENVSGDTVAAQLADLKRQIDNAVLGAIPDRSIDGQKIAKTAIASEHLQDGCVTAQKLAEHCIAGTQLADGAVTAEKIADGSISAEKFAAGLGQMVKRMVITESCTWRVPVSGLYRIMVIGGGGGGGAGMSVYKGGWTSTTQHFSGAGGSASKPVCGEFVLAAGTECEVIVGAGGAGRSTRTYTTSDTTPTFTAVDAEASEGGESSITYGGTLLLQSNASSRISGGEYKKSSPGKYGSAFDIYAGASGAGYSAGAMSGYVSTDDIATTKTVAGATNPNGGGKGADYSYDLITGGSTNHGEAGKAFGMGGGGGCMLGWVKNTGSSYVKTFVSRGGDGGSGAVIIEWVE